MRPQTVGSLEKQATFSCLLLKVSSQVFSILVLFIKVGNSQRGSCFSCGRKVATSTMVGMEGLGMMAQQLQCCGDFFFFSVRVWEFPTTHLVCRRDGNWICCGNSMVEQLGDLSRHLPLSPGKGLSPSRAWGFLISSCGSS